MTLPLRPKRGGFLRPFGCATFVRDSLLGKGPEGSPRIDPTIGAPQSDIFYHYKNSLLRAYALDRATRNEEKRARTEKRSIDPDRIQHLAERYLARLPYKTSFCRYRSFVDYFSNLQRLHWVEPTGREEKSQFQERYAAGQPRRYFRLTDKGRNASDREWANPLAALYGPRRPAAR